MRHGPPQAPLPAGAASPAPPRGGRLAVLVSGLQDNLLLVSKMKHVVTRAVEAGFTVDLFFDLVASGVPLEVEHAPVDFQASSPEGGESPRSLQPLLRASAADAGARLARLVVRQNLDPVEDSFPADPQNFTCRLQQYSPLTSHVGRRVLRRYKSVEGLFNAVLDATEAYDFVLWTRDDDQWLGPLDITAFIDDHNSTWRLYSKDCKSWGGINDKTLLFGWEAAKALLRRIYTDFWLPHERLSSVFNAEEYLAALARLRGVESVPVPYCRLPTAVAAYARPLGQQDGTPGAPPALCHNFDKLCGVVPDRPEFEKPVLCPASGADPAGVEARAAAMHDEHAALAKTRAGTCPARSWSLAKEMQRRRGMRESLKSGGRPSILECPFEASAPLGEDGPAAAGRPPPAPAALAVAGADEEVTEPEESTWDYWDSLPSRREAVAAMVHPAPLRALRPSLQAIRAAAAAGAGPAPHERKGRRP